MHQSRDTYSLTDFKQNTKEHIERLKATGRPEILTVNGKAEAVVMSPETYDKLFEMAMVDVRAKLEEGLAELRAGKGIDGLTAMKARKARRDAAIKALRRAG
jgi:prevent-host-death family protein